VIWEQAAWLLLAVLMSAALTLLVRRHALSRGVLDHPNARSSHTHPTPRGGGMSIVIVVSIAAALFIYRDMSDALPWAILSGGLAVAVVGYLDDRSSLPVRVRMIVHVASAGLAVFLLDGMPPIQWGAAVVHLGFWGDVLAVFAIVWMLNLFNFMDGIDGIAASEAAFVAAAGAGLCWLVGIHSPTSATAAAVAAASLGFLLWNWPPAKIFMGDVGSGYLGYVIGVLALATAREDPAALWTWVILGGVFLVDATVTLARRTARGERVYEAHRSHAYQWLARRWSSHKRVTLSVTAVNVLWLLPCAYFAALRPQLAAWTALVALTPLVIAAVAAGAGQRESG
jgi:Fuc2NAc and GlcNAc transferase